MNWNDHSRLKDQHAFLSASKYHWINYTDEKLVSTYLKHMAIERGTKLHEFAATAIRLGIKLPDNTKTLNMYVNDGIGFGLTPELTLYYSENCFGTADTIGYEKNFLRIHDLKTGENTASFHQLEVYAALFFLEYHIVPSSKIKMELRIYQNDERKVYIPEPDTIKRIMNKIIDSDKRIEMIKRGDFNGEPTGLA